MTEVISANETFPLVLTSGVDYRGISEFSYTLSGEVDNRNKNLYCAVSQVSMPFTIWNVAPEYSNNTFSYSPDAGVTWKPIDIPSGMYSVNDVNNAIHSVMNSNGDYDTASGVYYVNLEVSAFSTRIVLTVSNGYQIDFNCVVDFERTSRLGEMLGFVPGYTTYTEGVATAYTEIEGKYTADGIYYSGNLPNMNSVNLKPLTGVVIHSNLVTGTSLAANCDFDDVLYTLIPSNDIAPNEFVVKEPTHLIWRKVSQSSIKNIKVWFTNNTGEKVSLHGDPSVIELIFTRR